MSNTVPDPGRRVEARTSASSGSSCRECGGPIPGRRRNGFCSDRCRMQARRAERASRVLACLTDIETAVAELRRELRLGYYEPSPDTPTGGNG